MIDTLLQKLESGYGLPTLSPVAMRLVELATDDTSTAADLASLIEKDPSLTVRLLQLANSAFCRSGRSATTLTQAVVRLGFNRLRIMALSISLRDAFPMGKVGPLDYERFWRLSLYRALFAKSLADQLKSCDPEEVFVAGLIQEIGLPILFDLCIKGRDDEVVLALEPLEDLLALEKKRYGVTHREIGEIALKHWKFPEPVIASQTLYGAAARSIEAPVLDRFCELARRYVSALFQESADFPPRFTEADMTTGLDEDALHEIMLATLEQVEDIAASLRVEADKEKDLLELMERANKALSQISEKISRGFPASSEKAPPSFDSLDTRRAYVTRVLQAVAHEIRNPLTAVGGFARKLTSALDPETQNGKYARIVLEEASRLEQILSSMTQEFLTHNAE